MSVLSSPWAAGSSGVTVRAGDASHVLVSVTVMACRPARSELSQNLASPLWIVAPPKESPAGRDEIQGMAVADGTACAISTVTFCALQVGEATTSISRIGS